MSDLRERAAIAAMQGLLGHDLTTLSPRGCADEAVKYAEALLAKLARTAPKDESPLRCTAAERELIEAAIADPNGISARYNAAWVDVYEERRAAKDALPRAGGDQ